jgi:hypothetical protein
MKGDVMKIDPDYDISVFKVEVPLDDVNSWLVDVGAEIIDLNKAIDEAASFASNHGRSFVLIEIKAPSPPESK